MYSEAAISDVKARALAYELQPSTEKGQGRQRVYVCPACGHARIINPTAAGIWYCQRCHAKGDVFTAVRLRDNIEHSQAFADVMRRYATGGEAPSAAAKPITPTVATTTAPTTWAKQCGDYLRACSAALPGSAGEAYMQGRGFTLDTLRRFGVGYDAKARLHGALKFPRQAVIYPYSRRLDYYGARFLKPMTAADGSTVKAMKPTTAAAGNEPLFNGAALYSCEAVFICEGAFDAMAIMQGVHALNMAAVGAVALGGTGGGRLLDMLKAKPTRARLLICLDNDEPGKAGALALAAKLDNLGAVHAVIDGEAAFASQKDACELLQLDAGIMGDAVAFMLNEPAALMDYKG